MHFFSKMAKLTKIRDRLQRQRDRFGKDARVQQACTRPEFRHPCVQDQVRRIFFQLFSRLYTYMGGGSGEGNHPIVIRESLIAFQQIYFVSNPLF